MLSEGPPAPPNIRKLREAWAGDNTSKIALWNAPPISSKTERKRKIGWPTRRKKSYALNTRGRQKSSAAEREKPKLNAFDPNRRTA
jgi:hypothetical protein